MALGWCWQGPRPPERAGVISLPYAEIKEPFEAWYNLTGGKSRIEYYGGQVITYQFGSIEPFGASFKVTPETTETEVNVRKCFRINGTDGDLVAPQSVFPSLENFKGMEQPRRFGANAAVCPGRGDGRVRPRSGGFSCALCPAPGVQCEQWPAAGPEHRILANPMREFVGRAQDTDHVHHRLFHHYKERFGKSYGSEEEQEHRKRAFVHNMRFVHSKNRAALSYTLALNHLADRTPQELAVLRGRRRSRAPNNGQPFPSEHYAGLDLPESLDWRLYGAVTPVKDQAVCGSCWSFATTGAMEGALFLKTGVLTPLSQQVLIDCSWGFGNQACDGGEEWRAYEWIKKHGGIASTESYGPYLGQQARAVAPREPHFLPGGLIAPN
nr:PREDICTED: thiol protease aleurain-like [Apteryx mantelli mantelli]